MPFSSITETTSLPAEGEFTAILSLLISDEADTAELLTYVIFAELYVTVNIPDSNPFDPLSETVSSSFLELELNPAERDMLFV